MGDLIEIHKGTSSAQRLTRFGPELINSGNRLILQIASLDAELFQKQSQLQISISQTIASQFDLVARNNVTVRKVENSHLD